MIPEKSSAQTPTPIVENAVDPTRHRVRWSLLIFGAVTFIGGIAFWPGKSHALAPEVTEGVAVVAASPVTCEEIAREIVFDSELRPYQEIELHAKVAGYVQSINVDVGDHVKEGEVISQLELPEVEHDLERARATQRRAAQQIRRAQAAWDEAHLSLTRLTAIEKAQPNLIAQQDLDSATAKERAAEADLAAAKEQESGAVADVDKLKTMLRYARITAPFDGVVTKRYADKGALIQAGTSSSTQAMPLIRLSQNNYLRLVFPVSASFVSAIKQGDQVEVSIPGPGRKMEAKISRSSQKVDFSTRTMETEVDIENSDYSLIPGMYAAVRVKVERKSKAIVAPITTIARRGDSATVYLIGKDGTIEERAVKLGLESPFKIEILSGVIEGDLLLVGNRTGLKPGQHVTPKVDSTSRIPVS